jgi:hypothetical protein
MTKECDGTFGPSHYKEIIKHYKCPVCGIIESGDILWKIAIPIDLTREDVTILKSGMIDNEPIINISFCGFCRSPVKKIEE